MPIPPAELRAAMVAHLRRREIRDERVLAAMGKIPRHEFVPAVERGDAYVSRPLAIGLGQTASAPYMVAAMTELLELGAGARVLEIGSGCGYQTAVLCELGCEVYAVELLAPLAAAAEGTLAALGYRAHVRVGDGYRGWPEAQPFDGCLIAATAPRIPAPLLAQLRVGARLVLPLSRGLEQTLVRLTRTAAGFDREDLYRVRFVPMHGEIEKPEG